MSGELGAARAGAQAGQLSASGAPYPTGTSGVESLVTCYWIQFFPKDSEERVAYQHVADAIRDRYDLGRLANNVILPQYYQIREFNRINTMCLQTLLLIRGNYYTEALPSYAITELMLEITNDFITGLHHLTRANPKATEIIDWLSSHLDADLTVRGLADHFEMNYRYVSRLIKKETGMTASRLILQKKIGHCLRAPFEVKPAPQANCGSDVLQ